jgi:hypothetical protein
VEEAGANELQTTTHSNSNTLPRKKHNFHTIDTPSYRNQQ